MRVITTSTVKAALGVDRVTRIWLAQYEGEPATWLAGGVYEHSFQLDVIMRRDGEVFSAVHPLLPEHQRTSPRQEINRQGFFRCLTPVSLGDTLVRINGLRSEQPSLQAERLRAETHELVAIGEHPTGLAGYFIEAETPWLQLADVLDITYTQRGREVSVWTELEQYPVRRLLQSRSQ